MTDEDFLTDFHHVATIGATPANGVHRQAATVEDQQTREWFITWAANHGFETRIDSIGNTFACHEWTPGAPYVLVGSHLDSQPLGGRFDGAYGVIAALHAAADTLRRAADEGTTPAFNLAVVNWFNEEGGRFAPSMMGSSVYAGIHDGDAMRAVTDLDGVTVAEALDAIGHLGSDTAPTCAAYAEIHIEQGRILEREAIDVGLVTSSWYTQKLDIEVVGEQSHTGATAMSDRRDALVAASEVVLKVHDVTDAFALEQLVSSVGRFVVEPNSPIVVARRVHLVADIRSADPTVVQEARARLLHDFAEIAERRNVDIIARDFDIREIRRFPEAGIERAAEAVRANSLSSRRIQTMAGHDSVAMNSRVPAVMLFIPSVDGVSHCEREFTTDEDMVNGLHVLRTLLWDLVGGSLSADEPWSAPATA